MSKFYKTGVDCIAGINKLKNIGSEYFNTIKLKDIKGKDKVMADYIDNDNKALLIVNVASECGLTNDNYNELMVLYNKYTVDNKRNLQILAFPCNQFMGQESKSEEEINNTVCNRFKVKFPLFSKIDVNGENTEELFQYLKVNSEELYNGDDNVKNIHWNFGKFLLNVNGKVLKYYEPLVKPSDMEKDIEMLIGGNMKVKF